MAPAKHDKDARAGVSSRDSRKRKTRPGGAWNRLRSIFPRAESTPGRVALRVLAVVLILIVLVIVASFFVDEPLRRSMERRMNASLKGYSVRIPKLHFSLFGASITLHDMTVRQQQNPDPPVAVFPTLKASVQWTELLTFHLVADMLLERPRIHLNLLELQAENRDATAVKDKGWQDALEQIYPLKINLFRVDDADVVYIDKSPEQPLHIAHLYLRANNIRNIHSHDHVYPSPIHAEGIVFEKGHLAMDGHADFLAKPTPGVHALFRLDQVPLDRLHPISARANLELKGGTLSTNGEVEYAAKTKAVHIALLSITGLRLDYLHTPETAGAEAKRQKKVSAAASQASNRSDLDLRLDRLELTDGNLGYVNRAKDPAYRAFLSNTRLTMTNLSNQFRHGPATVQLTGRFMGSGASRALAHFRPDSNGPDFDLDAAIEHTEMVRMNDLLRAYGKFDVVAGDFSFFTQLRVHDGHIEGYIKPLFRDMKVYDKRQDADKSLFRKLYEGLVGGVAHLLENRSNEAVATKADISGPVNNPKSSTFQVIGRLIENAFFRAILPGFDRNLTSQKATK